MSNRTEAVVRGRLLRIVGLGDGERQEGHDLLTGRSETLSARGQDARGSATSHDLGEQVAQAAADVLAVVQDEQPGFGLEEVRDGLGDRAAWSRHDTELRRHDVRARLGLPGLSEVHEGDQTTVVQLVGDGDSQP